MYDTYAPALRPLVARFFPNPFEREEATQELWLLVHRMAGMFDPARGELLAWLRAVAVNRCKELLRARGRRPEARDVIDDDTLVAPSDPEAAAGGQRLRAAVVRFCAALPAQQAAVFQLSLVEEQSHEQVAATVGISARRCKYLRMKLLARAAADPELRAALREVIEP